MEKKADEGSGWRETHGARRAAGEGKGELLQWWWWWGSRMGVGGMVGGLKSHSKRC